MLDLRQAPPSDCLSDEETSVAALVGQGLWSHEIGELVSLSEEAVDERIAAAMAKLGIEDRLDFRLYAKLRITGK